VLLGVGVDILLIDRIRRSLASPLFMRRTFTDAEQSQGGRRADPDSYYARVFAGKEAVFKCLGIAGDHLATWLDIEIIDRDEVQPEVELNGSMEQLASAQGAIRVCLSLSSDTDYAVAFAAILREGVQGD
jgi:holo-[acyl-carrier protein] synthase